MLPFLLTLDTIDILIILCSVNQISERKNCKLRQKTIVFGLFMPFFVYLHKLRIKPQSYRKSTKTEAFEEKICNVTAPQSLPRVVQNTRYRTSTHGWQLFVCLSEVVKEGRLRKAVVWIQHHWGVAGSQDTQLATAGLHTN